MSLRNEQCMKVCRILDDVLANRSTERDALIVAVRTAFDELEERKDGEWIYKNDLKQFFCSECGFPSLTYDDTYIYGMDLPNYCEDCGAKMRKPEEDIPMEYFESGGR